MVQRGRAVTWGWGDAARLFGASAPDPAAGVDRAISAQARASPGRRAGRPPGRWRSPGRSSCRRTRRYGFGGRDSDRCPSTCSTRCPSGEIISSTRREPTPTICSATTRFVWVPRSGQAGAARAGLAPRQSGERWGACAARVHLAARVPLTVAVARHLVSRGWQGRPLGVMLGARAPRTPAQKTASVSVRKSRPPPVLLVQQRGARQAEAVAAAPRANPPAVGRCPSSLTGGGLPGSSTARPSCQSRASQNLNWSYSMYHSRGSSRDADTEGLRSPLTTVAPLAPAGLQRVSRVTTGSSLAAGHEPRLGLRLRPGLPVRRVRPAHNDHHRELRARRAKWRPERQPNLKHGTRSTYSNHGCRCPACFQAQADWNRRDPAGSRGDPRHELFVLTIGLFISSLCVVGLIILWLG